MFSTAIFKKPSAILKISIIGSFFSLEIISDKSKNFFFTISKFKGWSPVFPKTFGKKSGFNLPNKTLQSVTVKGPPLPYDAGPGIAPALSGPTWNLPSL